MEWKSRQLANFSCRRYSAKFGTNKRYETAKKQLTRKQANTQANKKNFVRNIFEDEIYRKHRCPESFNSGAS